MRNSSGTNLNAGQPRPRRGEAQEGPSHLRSPLAKVLGQGSAKEGVQHWWAQRLTSVALVPLTVWFVVCLLSLPSYDHAMIVAWMGQLWTAVFLILLVLTAAWHSQLGVRVVVEDYVHGSGTKTLMLTLVTFFHVVVAVAGVLAILEVAFGGAG
ncbi:MAG TPA: succinate dehydrogenase, hydrophobic membrane anchor protein [Steroidobacteraceae bacterium]|nr:succinate dehydrogenase, hydrophobic membrane anchor protein [Steroidobacteraceae bacterium]